MAEGSRRRGLVLMWIGLTFAVTAAWGQEVADASGDSWEPAAAPQEAGPGGDAFEEDAAARSQNTGHAVMQQFLHNFQRNMKYAVLEDSKGDLPEAERQRMLQELQPAGEEVGDAQIEDAFPGARQQSSETPVPKKRKHALLHKHHRRHAHRGARMLNAPPTRSVGHTLVDDDKREDAEQDGSIAQRSKERVTIVRDAMGRPMPLMFGAQPQVPLHSSASRGAPLFIGLMVMSAVSFF